MRFNLCNMLTNNGSWAGYHHSQVSAMDLGMCARQPVVRRAGRGGSGPTWPEKLRCLPATHRDLRGAEADIPPGSLAGCFYFGKPSCLSLLEGLRSSSQQVQVPEMSLLSGKGLCLVVTTPGGLPSWFHPLITSELLFESMPATHNFLLSPSLICWCACWSTLEPRPSLAPSFFSSSQLCAFVPPLQQTGPFQGRQLLSLPCPTPARGFLILRTKSTSPHDPFNPPAGPLSLHHPSLLLGQYFSWTFHPAPWECPVPALCTAPVASLGPGHSADHSPRLSLCPVFMEHSLCFGPVHLRMCAP